MPDTPDVVVVGGGHNGLIAACYLAKGGLDVLVVEALDRAGGGSRTEEQVPGHRFDLHSVAHNIINMTSIPAELDLAGVGLEYREMDPFSVSVGADGRIVRFHRSIDATVASIAEHDRAEADAYRRFLDAATPLVDGMLPAVTGEGRLPPAPFLRAVRKGGGVLPMARDLLGPYDALLRRWLPSDLTRAPVAAFAAHGAAAPSMPGGAVFAFWQAVYHRHGQWHAVGGSQGLTDALLARAAALGVTVRVDAPVARIEAGGGTVRAVVLAGGERIRCPTVVTALDPKLALLDLLDPPLAGRAGADLAATRRGNVVQALVHVAIDRLPPYPNARPGDHHGLQSFVDSLDDLSRAGALADAGLLATDPLPLYAFTTSALDDTLAPAGHHTAYLACPVAPAVIDGGWPAATDRFVEAALATVEARAPGFRDSIVGLAPWTPDLMAAGGRWPGAHPMHLDLALHQLGPFRPTPALARHRTPVDGLYVSGAGTAPMGGIAGTPGRAAAQRVLRDLRRRR